MQYKTTALFLESFGLNSLDDLPQLELEPGQPLELNLLLPAEQELPEPPVEHDALSAENQTDAEAPAVEASEDHNALS